MLACLTSGVIATWSFAVMARDGLVLLGYLVLDNLLPFALGGAGSGVAFGAHIGGFVAGAVSRGEPGRVL